MAQEWTPQGVRVNGLTPGSVATDMILPEDAEKRARFVAEMSEQNLFGRIADPSEMVEKLAQEQREDDQRDARRRPAP